MKDTNKTMDNLLDTCKLFAATILVAVLLLTFAGCEKGRVNDAPTQTIPTTQQTTQPETTQAPTIKEPPRQSRPYRRQRRLPARRKRGKSSLRRACWKTTASRRNTMKTLAMESIRST